MALPTRDQMHAEVDRIFRDQFPTAPERLDPDDPNQADHVAAWLDLRNAIVNDWTNDAFFEFFPTAGKLDPNDPGDSEYIEYWLDIRDQIRDDAPPKYDWSSSSAASASDPAEEVEIVLSWVEFRREGEFRFTFEGVDPTQQQAEWFLWPNGVPEAVTVTRSGILRYDVAGLNQSAMSQMRPDVAARVRTTDLFVDTQTEDEAAADYQRRVQENDEALSTLNPDVGMTWREIHELGDGWHEINNNFIWQGFEGGEHSIQTHPYFDDEGLNDDMRFFLNQDQSVNAALLSIERNWRDISRMLVLRLMAGAY